ncbi:alpha-amylase family glycosyl hydrolase [Corallincola luteus]|nr:alpha-amylase family glycosyl hydrolase [Corallincola luteus]
MDTVTTKLADTKTIGLSATSLANNALSHMDDFLANNSACGGRDVSTFRQAIANEIEQIAQDYTELYAPRADAQDVFISTLKSVFDRWYKRPTRLAQRDSERVKDPDFYNDHKMIGASCYIDLFAGDIQGMIGKIDYFKSLGITYLYILPPFKVPTGANDGGFAVSDYKTIRPDLGTMDEMTVFIEKCHENGIDVVLDFVLNHTADDHEWALKAQQGLPEFEDFYMFFDDENEVNEIIQHVEATFPDKGENIVFNPKVNRWVWTTFMLNQWDLNYHNPNVLAGMLDNVLFLANVGVDVLRLDAVSLVWKEKGTSCKSLPQIQTLVRLFTGLAKLAAPSMQFKSEAIVKPQEVAEYVDHDSATLAYRPLLSSTLWHALATGSADLIGTSLERWSALPKHCTWINYIRSHDDVPWVFSDLDIQFTGADAAATKLFLDTFYSGQHEDSFAKGLPFMRDKDTHLARISGTTASLAGLESALASADPSATSMAIQRIALLHSVFMSVGGLPLIYLGDEVAALNDYSFNHIPAKQDDSRWVNRPMKLWQQDDEALQSPSSPTFQVYHAIRRMIAVRKNEPSLTNAAIKVLNVGQRAVLCYRRGEGKAAVTVMANFSEFSVDINPHYLAINDISGQFVDQLNEQAIDSKTGITLAPYQSLWLKNNNSKAV